MYKKYIWKLMDRIGISSFSDDSSISIVKKKLLRYDIISFDIFDTLIFRSVSAPSDVFDMVGTEIEDPWFKKKRIDAEEVARNYTEGREPNIEEIYSYVKVENPSTALTLELEKELQVCNGNPYMKALVEQLVKKNKEIIVVSDMYLPVDFLEKMLNKCGFKGLARIYVSNQYRASKYDGSLYRELTKDCLDGGRIIHVGDNVHSDYMMARENGWDALHYKRKTR